jgi:hypothetical protein
VERHLDPDDPRRQEFERIAQRLNLQDPGQPLPHTADNLTLSEQERVKIVSTVRGADEVARRNQLSVGNFGNIVVVTTVVMTGLAAGVALIGFYSPTTIPLCFQSEKSGQTLVVCPTGQSTLVTTAQQSVSAGPDVADPIEKTVGRKDLIVVELVGLIAASVAAANAIRALRDSSDPWSLSVALAALKLPTGALTAFLGILLMRGQIVPGLTALDTSAQILAWALVFGYAQQLFTRIVDQQAQTITRPPARRGQA